MEKLAKLSDLARMRGVRGIRAKLYYDMGIQTVAQMAQWTPDDLVRAANKHVAQSGFEGIATLPKEAQFTVALANQLPRLAEFP
jgi:predicted flap endonuclease-1-like 5' DNA nuclease